MSTDVYIDVNHENWCIKDVSPKADAKRVGYLSLFIQYDFQFLDWLQQYNKAFPILTFHVIDTIVKMFNIFEKFINEERLTYEFRDQISKESDPNFIPDWANAWDDIIGLSPLAAFLAQHINETWCMRVD